MQGVQKASQELAQHSTGKETVNVPVCQFHQETIDVTVARAQEGGPVLQICESVELVGQTVRGYQDRVFAANS